MKNPRVLNAIRGSVLGPIRKALLISSLLFGAAVHAADVNVLIIGSERDTSQNVGGTRNSVAFSGSGIKTQLENILGGAGLGTVKVQYEDRSTTSTNATNLATWFFWSAETSGAARWANLRGAGGTDWDYVVLIGDPYTIEYMPGLYAHGVAKVAAEVSAGGAETILLMPWPGANSDRTVAHYKEVVYRAGRSGGHKVAPAALAWQAAGSPATGNTHPNNDGAFICAASIYSRIYNQSAAAVSNYNDALANTVHNTVTANVGQPQYSGVFSFQSPLRGFWDRNRSVNPGKAFGGSSTEDGLADRAAEAVRRTGATSGGGTRYPIGRDTDDPLQPLGYASGPSAVKDYRNGGPGLPAFGYMYQWYTGTINSQSMRTSDEIKLANRMIGESDNFSILPWRYIMADAWKQDNTVIVSGDGEHLHSSILNGTSTYMYTLISGRCPLNSKPNPVTSDWLGMMAGYQMAWHAMTCQSRAPGFQAKPKSATIGFKTPETMTVRFFLPPQDDVTVSISSSSTDISLSTQTLTFTPANYDQPQVVELLAKSGAVSGAPLNITVTTASNDEVYNGLYDTWSYKVNTKPEADSQSISVFENEIVATTLTATDANGEALTYRIGTPPTNGTVTLDGAVAVYEPNAGYTGPDSFTFIANDRSDDSDPATVSITVKAKPLYGTNLLKNGSAELSPITDYGWVNKAGSWGQYTQSESNAFIVDGTYAFMNQADASPAELYQDVAVSAFADRIAIGDQAFNITGHIFSRKGDDSRVYVRCLDSSGTKLSEYDSGVAPSKYPGETISADFVAPVGTATIRVLFHSMDGGDAGQRGQGLFDGFKLSAIQPPGNAAPTAHAGYNQTVADNDDNGSESVTLDGSASDDIDGTIASYVWTEGGVEIATGVNPDVTLALGEHLITLTVTDNEGATGTDTVTIQVDGPNNPPSVEAGPDQAASLIEGAGVGEPVTGAHFEWDAAKDAGGNDLWTNTGSGSYDWQFTQSVTPSAVDDARFDVLTHAYEFSTAKSLSQATLENFINSEASVTWEFVLRTDANASDGIIMESGGAVDGIQIWIENGSLKAQVRDDEVPATVSHPLNDNDKSRFIHVVFVVDMGAGMVSLYVDGGEPITTSWTGADWCGSDDAGLGTVGGLTAPTGSTAEFSGRIALIRCYENKAFSAAEVATNFDALSSGPSASVTLSGASVTDTDTSQNLSAQWSVVSQPEGSWVSFDDPTLVNATATFGAIGEYTLKLTGTDDYTSREDTVTITVSGTFAQWIAMHGLGELSGFGQDADGDGISNGLESYFGTDPGSASTAGVTAGAVERGADSLTFTFSHPLNDNPSTDITANYRWSSNLDSFHLDGATDGSTVVNFTQSPSSSGWVTVTATATGVIPERLFVDIQVSQ